MRTLLIAIGAALVLGACQKGPTEPTRDDSNTYMVSADLVNAAGAATIGEAHLELDGKAVQVESYDAPTADATFLVDEPAAEGQHTVTFRLYVQTSSSSTTYRVPAWDLSLSACPGGVFSDDGGFSRSVHMPEQTLDLTAGKGISYTFYMPDCDTGDDE